MKKLIFLFLALSLAAGTALAKDELAKPLVPFQGDIRANETEDNGTCLTANILTPGDPMNAAIGVSDDLDYFEVIANEGDCFTFETHAGDIGDTKLYLWADDCATQLAYDDDGGEGYYSMIQYTFDAAGVYFVEVTGYNSGYTGTYILTMDPCPGPQPNDTCEGAIQLLDGAFDFQVDLCLFANDYFDAASCTNYSQNGPDAVYMVDLMPGGSIMACENPAAGAYVDLSIYLITDCTDVYGSCVAGDDSGNPECIDYTSEMGGIYYLIIDSYSGCGLLDVTGEVNNPVATQGSNWSTMKTLY